MSSTPLKRQIDGRGRIDVPDSMWQSIGLKEGDYAYILPDKDQILLRKTISTPTPEPTPTPTPDPTPTPTPPPTNVLLSDTFDSNYSLTPGQSSPNGIWLCKYIGSGKVASENGVLHLVPKAATNYANDSSGVGYETYAAQVNSKQVFKDFQLDIDMTTNKQLRTGWSKYGVNNQGPQPWEVGWVFFRFTDEPPKSNHHYYFIIRGDKLEFGKKDNKPGDSTVEQQIYLPKVSDNPKLKIGVANHVTVIAKGFHITIIVDGNKVVDFTDVPNDPTKMSQGLVCMYTEDAEVSFDNVKIVPAP